MGGAPHRNARSWIALVLGAVSLGTGLAWMLAAGWGVAPLDAFIAGTSALTGFTVGTVIIGVSLVFLVGSWILGSRPGWGTLIAFVGVGAVVDAWNLLVFDFLGWSPATWTIALRVGLWAVGFALFAGGVVATLASDLCASTTREMTATETQICTARRIEQMSNNGKNFSPVVNRQRIKRDGSHAS